LPPGPVTIVSAMETSRLAAIPLFADLDEAGLATIAAAAVAVEAAERCSGGDVWAIERRSSETAERLRQLIEQ
jgi:hypothetical protein